MSTPEPIDDDRGFEAALGRLLVVASSGCLAAGLVLALARPTRGPQGLLLTIGLLLLMATPAARVILSAFTYLRRRDWVFAILTLVVLLELVASVFVAFKR
jgi:ABC-type branched-subunit amino acid transport system permease subunit